MRQVVRFCQSVAFLGLLVAIGGPSYGDPLPFECNHLVRNKIKCPQVSNECPSAKEPGVCTSSQQGFVLKGPGTIYEDDFDRYFVQPPNSYNTEQGPYKPCYQKVRCKWVMATSTCAPDLEDPNPTTDQRTVWIDIVGPCHPGG